MKNLFTKIVAATMLTVIPVMAISPVYASGCGANASDSKSQVLQGAGETGSNCSEDGVGNALDAVVTILSVIAGIAGVIMVIISGFRYITSGGDSNKVSAAKTALVYALIGLAIAALAQVLVHFAINTADNATSPPPAATKSTKAKKNSP